MLVGKDTSNGISRPLKSCRLTALDLWGTVGILHGPPSFCLLFRRVLEGRGGCAGEREIDAEMSNEFLVWIYIFGVPDKISLARSLCVWRFCERERERGRGRGRERVPRARDLGHS